MSMLKLKTALVGLFGLAFATATAAANPMELSPDPEDDLEVPVATVGFVASAGVRSFADERTRAMFDTGAAWELRAVFGLNQALALEAAYHGGSQMVTTADLDTNLMSHGFEAALRLNLGLEEVQPYFMAGAGWTHFSLDSGGIESVLAGDDDVFSVPLGGGISFNVDGAIIDARFVYRFAFDDELLGEVGEFFERRELNHWALTAGVGFAF